MQLIMMHHYWTPDKIKQVGASEEGAQVLAAQNPDAIYFFVDLTTDIWDEE